MTCLNPNINLGRSSTTKYGGPWEADLQEAIPIGIWEQQPGQPRPHERVQLDSQPIRRIDEPFPPNKVHCPLFVTPTNLVLERFWGSTITGGNVHEAVLN
jgi:hypothetical protein